MHLINIFLWMRCAVSGVMFMSACSALMISSDTERNKRTIAVYIKTSRLIYHFNSFTRVVRLKIYINVIVILLCDHFILKTAFRMLEMAFMTCQNPKIFWGGMPQTPLVVSCVWRSANSMTALRALATPLLKYRWLPKIKNCMFSPVLAIFLGLIYLKFGWKQYGN